MLEFYHDFLDKFVSRDDFVLTEMDTDSSYFGVSIDPTDVDDANILDKLVKPDMMEEYLKVKKDFYVVD